MNDEKGRFLRIYFDRLERNHADVWYDPTCLSTYVRLLALSEKAWPSMPELPVSSRRADLRKLQAGGMIEFLPNHRFVLEGWIKERETRAKIARENVAKRPDRATTVPTTVPTTVDTTVRSTVLPVRAPASFSSSTSSSTEGVQGEPDSWDAFHRRTGEVPGQKMRDWLNELCEAHGESRVVEMIGRLQKTQRTSVDYLKAVRDALRAADYEAERVERQAEKAAVQRKRAPLKVIKAPDDVTPEEAKRIADEYLAEEKAARQGRSA